MALEEAPQGQEPDDELYWDCNEYAALKIMLSDLSYHEWAGGDPEIYERYKRECQRFRELRERFQLGSASASS